MKRHADTLIQAPAQGVSRRQMVSGLAALSAAGLAPLAHAQFQVEVRGVGLTQRPFAVAAFEGRQGAPVDVDQIVIADLERSGLFRHVMVNGEVLNESTRPDLAPWKAFGVDALVTGSVRQMPDGRWDVRYRLWDVVQGQDLGGVSFPVEAGDLRLAAHKVSDSIYEKLTGDPGIFSTRIAYVTQVSKRFSLWVADADGQNAQVALASPEPIISPTWSPDGTRLAYVSFESQKPVIYVHTVATGKRQLVANFKGSNSAPAWSPDGQRLVATLTLAGHSQIYSVNLSTNTPERLTDSVSIDTEPVWSKDGQYLYFVSDRGGSPQIYRMAAVGGAASRVTYTGNYNVSPDISPDGKTLVYVSRVNGAFRLHAMDLETGAVRALTRTSADESPSFSANGRMIMYATRIEGQEALMTTTADGRIRSRLAGAVGDIREPAWGPFRQ